MTRYQVKEIEANTSFSYKWLITNPLIDYDSCDEMSLIENLFKFNSNNNDLIEFEKVFKFYFI